MRIGIPRETTPLEGRVALVPEACGQLAAAGHGVIMERHAGYLSGYSDADYTASGVHIVKDPSAVFQDADLILKVKEPQDSDLAHLRQHHLLFCFLHLAANAKLTRALQALELTAVAFETVEDDNGRLPLLAPMSDIAGRIATQIGSNLLHQPRGGKGLLLGGIPATDRGRVVVVGAGAAGGNAASLAAGMGADVVVFDVNRDRLAAMHQLGHNVTALYPYQEVLTREITTADITIGAILKTGGRAPHVITREMVRRMQPGSVVIDIAVDQGGCIETTRPTTYADPTYIEEDVVHFAVTNIPGAVPRTASQALSAALIPYVQMLSGSDWRDCKPLRKGINLDAGRLVHPALKETFA